MQLHKEMLTRGFTAAIFVSTNDERKHQTWPSTGETILEQVPAVHTLRARYVQVTLVEKWKQMKIPPWSMYSKWGKEAIQINQEVGKLHSILGDKHYV